MTNYYKVLGVKKSATPDEIKHAFHQLARKYHPDLHGGKAHPKMAQITEAFHALSDPTRRALYDRTGSADPVRVKGKKGIYLIKGHTFSGDLARFYSATDAGGEEVLIKVARRT